MFAMQKRYRLRFATPQLDASGDFSAHSDITSGTIAEDGSVTITFATPPDNPSDILFNEYTTKGFVQKLMEAITTNQFTEVVDTGDSVKTVFANTLSNTTIAKGQMLLRFKIASQVYWVWDNGVDFQHDNIVTSSIDYGTGAVSITFDTPIDSGFDVDILYTTGAPGADWIVLHDKLAQDNTQAADAFPGLLLKEYIVTNCGSSWNDRLVVGIRETQYIPNNQFLVELNLYRFWNENEKDVGEWNFTGAISTAYNATTEHFTQLPSFSFNDDEMTYWFSTTKDRINGINKVSNAVYSSFAFGIGKRLGASKAEYPQPYYIIGNGAGDFSFSSIASNHTAIIYPSNTFALICLTPENDYEAADDINFAPTEYQIAASDIKKTTNNKLIVFEIFAVQFDPNPDRVLFEIPDIYYTPFIDMATEDILDDGVDTFLVSQNIFRSDVGDFFAIKII